ncbi:MAG: LytTR family transcriptional regulator DNA-binding domain-containing protein [Ferruginibacter sp.]
MVYNKEAGLNRIFVCAKFKLSRKMTASNTINDNWVFYIICPLAAILVVHIGNDNAFSTLLKTPSYYTDLAFALGCSLITCKYLQLNYQAAEKKFDWQLQLRERINWQLLYAFLLPLFLLVLLELIYVLFILNIPFRKLSVFYLELPVMAIILGGLNLVYAFLYYKQYQQELIQMLEDEKNKLSAGTHAESYRNSYMVYKGGQAINIQNVEVAYFVLLSKTTFLVTRQGEKYLYNQPIEAIFSDADPAVFFQLNRQITANRYAIKSFEATDTRRLLVNLLPPAGFDVYVSKARSGIFTRWMQMAVPVPAKNLSAPTGNLPPSVNEPW